MVKVEKAERTSNGVEATCRVVLSRDPPHGVPQHTLLDGIVVEIPSYLILDLLDAAGVEYQGGGV